MHSTRQLPPQYRQLLAVDLQKDRKTALLINGLAVLLFAILCYLGHRLVPVGSLLDSSQGLGFYFLRLFLLLAGLVAYIVLHELTHGAVMRYYGAEHVRFGFTGLYAYAGSKEDYFDKHAYRRIALAPLLVWTVLLGLGCALVPRSWFWVLWFIQINNLAGCMGDLYVTLKFSSLSDDILILDTGVDMTVYGL